jgi:hypothetical protein
MYREREEVRDRVKAGMPSVIAHKLCFIPTIDDPDVHVSLSSPPHYPNLTSYEKWVSYKGSYAEQADKVVTWKNLFVIVLYQLVVVGAWVWLQAFTGTFLNE